MYYPKSQIKPNQFTAGGELMVARTKENYVGFYYTLANGKAYVGKEPNGLISDELIQNPNNTPSVSNDNENYRDENYFIEDSSYYNAKPKNDFPIVPRNPKSSQVLPTEEDYKAGKYTKYFVSKTNEIRFIQVYNTEYLKFKNKSSEVNWSLYEPIELEWVIGGDRKTAFLTNKASVHSISTKYPGFGSVFKNRYDRFWRSK